MKRYTNILVFIGLTFLVITCKKENPKKDTITEGTADVLVDETVVPIIEAQVQIFEGNYKAKINIIPKSEAELMLSLIKDSSRIAILSRTLTTQEQKAFEGKKLYPKITAFAKDGIALITNESNKDSLIALQDLIDFMKGKPQSKFKGLVFDNPNSSTARYITSLSGLKELPTKNVFSFKTNNDVIKYVAENSGMIGVVGLNYIYEPSPEMLTYIRQVNVLNVRNDSDNQYYSPTQNNIAEGKYPLARDLYIVNCQGYSGLGMGFRAFMTSETGQRIVLKSGLVPIQVPTRKFRVRNQIANEKK